MKAGFLAAVVVLNLATAGHLLTAQQGRKPEEQALGKAAGLPANQIAALQVDFKNRIDHYMETRKEAAKGAPPMKETNDPGKIQVAEASLAARIQTLRATAQPGDIFTPAIQKTIRQLLSPEMKGKEGKDTKEILKDDAPKSVPLKVNTKYPEKATLPTVPSNLLLSLPRLPEELEYRIIGKDLILRDTGADLIVDFMMNAIK
jgi:hypothetical protein